MSPTSPPATRAERAAEAASLRAEGLNGIQIADRLGISRTYAYDLLNDPTGEQVKARKRRYAGTCVDCGGKTDGSSGRAKSKRCASCQVQKQHADAYWTHDRVVQAIRDSADADGEPPVSTDWVRGENGHPAIATVQRVFGSWNAAIEAAGFQPRHAGDQRSTRRYRREAWPLIERRWREGATTGEIGVELGTTKQNVRATLRRMRKAGIDLPVRATDLRGTHCRRGHEFTEKNTIVYPDGGRRCRTCIRLRSSRRSRLAA